MSQIRIIETENEAKQFAAICARAYPRFPYEKLLESIELTQQDDPDSDYYVFLENNEVLAGMRLLKYQLNLYGTFVTVGGVGMVAVDLLHKKKHIAKQLISYFLTWCKKQEATLAMLYPFRPDFYFKMGFGYGPTMARYCFTPHSLPYDGHRDGLVYLKPDDFHLIETCYNRFAEKQHGYCLRNAYEAKRRFKQPLEAGKVVGFKHNNQLDGYVVFDSKAISQDNMLHNYLNIREWLWHSPQALQRLCNFLYVQADQYERIIFNTQQEDFHYLLKDVRNGSNHLIPSVYHECFQAGVGLMYRIVDAEAFLLQLASSKNFNQQSVKLNLTVEDSFLDNNQQTFALQFEEGQLRRLPTLADGINMNIRCNELASLLLGSVELPTLYKMGLVTVAEQDLSILTSLFAAQKPQCITAF